MKPNKEPDENMLANAAMDELHKALEEREEALKEEYSRLESERLKLLKTGANTRNAQEAQSAISKSQIIIGDKQAQIAKDIRSFKKIREAPGREPKDALRYVKGIATNALKANSFEAPTPEGTIQRSEEMRKHAYRKIDGYIKILEDYQKMPGSGSKTTAFRWMMGEKTAAEKGDEVAKIIEKLNGLKKGLEGLTATFPGANMNYLSDLAVMNRVESAANLVSPQKLKELGSKTLSAQFEKHALYDLPLVAMSKTVTQTVTQSKKQEQFDESFSENTKDKQKEIEDNVKLKNPGEVNDNSSRMGRLGKS